MSYRDGLDEESQKDLVHIAMVETLVVKSLEVIEVF